MTFPLPVPRRTSPENLRKALFHAKAISPFETLPHNEPEQHLKLFCYNYRQHTEAYMESFIENLKKQQLMVAIRTKTPEDAYNAASACAKGGIRFIEITFSVPEAEEAIRQLSKDKRVSVGAGTILNIDDAKRALKAGASYLVSPNFDEEVVKFTKKEGAVSIPGACTPTEIYRAHKAGGDIIKLFPFVEIGGLNFLKAVRGPLPFVNYMLCGGANLDNISQYLAANATGILIGAAIIKPHLVAAKDWNSIAGLAEGFAKTIPPFSRISA
jgi:2-dehydro-3-deoxyphosphogluconate aldolase/(4S)-4-hydroxy-2-oxoglutarate aldolase